MVRLAASLTLTVMIATPVAAGCTVMVRLAPLPPKVRFAFGTAAVLLELAVTIKLAGAVAGSPTVKANAPVPLGKVTFWLAITVIVGAEAELETFTWNVVVVVWLDALVTLTVIVVGPAATGVMVRVRFAPLPPTVRLAFGTAAVLLEIAVTTKFAGGVTASPTVNGNGPRVLGKVTA